MKRIPLFKGLSGSERQAGGRQGRLRLVRTEVNTVATLFNLFRQHPPSLNLLISRNPSSTHRTGSIHKNTCRALCMVLLCVHDPQVFIKTLVLSHDSASHNTMLKAKKKLIVEADTNLCTYLHFLFLVRGTGFNTSSSFTSNSLS
jgi:hypothetical protein